MRCGFEESFFITTVQREKFILVFFLQLGFTPCKAEQPLQGMELQEKEAQKEQSIQGISLEGTHS